MKENSIGVGITTCNRADMLGVLIDSLDKCDVSEIIIINDGDEPVDQSIRNDQETVLINNDENLGVGKCKNMLLQRLFDSGHEHIFLIEDDMKIVDPNIFDIYIGVAEHTGLLHLNFCLHGEDNKKNGVANPKLIVDYGDVSVSLYHNIYGALSYYHRSVIDQIGLMDEGYMNAMEHVDHTMQVIKAGYHPPFRWFADVTNSDKLITEQDNNHSDSVIRKDQEWINNFKHGVERFYHKFDINVCSNNQQCADKEQVIQSLKRIKTGDG